MAKHPFIRTIVVGAASAAAAMLFAPKSGKDLRNDIMDQANSLKDQAMGKVQDLTDEIKQTYQQSGEESDYTDPELEDTIEDIETDLNGIDVDAPGYAATNDVAVPPVGPDVRPPAETPVTPGTEPGPITGEDAITNPEDPDGTGDPVRYTTR